MRNEGITRIECQAMIDAAVSAAYAQINNVIAANQNVSITNLPSATTALTTAGGAGTVLTTTAALTLKTNSGLVKATVIGYYLPTNTFQAVIATSVSAAANSVNTVSQSVQGNQEITLPAATGATPGAPSVNVLTLRNTTAWKAGQTVQATLTLIPTTTGATVPANGIQVILEEIY